MIKIFYSPQNLSILLLVLTGLFFTPSIANAQAVNITDESRQQVMQQILILYAELTRMQALLSEQTENVVNDKSLDNSTSKRIADWNETLFLNSSCATTAGLAWIHCFGGRGTDTAGNRPVFFDPESSRPGYYDEFMPRTYASSCAADSVNDHIYCFGGHLFRGGSVWELSDDIYLLEPGERSLGFTILDDAKLPAGASGMSCVEHPGERRIYCVGGYLGFENEVTSDYEVNVSRHGQVFSNYVVVLDLQTQEVEVIDTADESTLGVDDLSCAFSDVDEKIYCFGGDTGSGYTLETDTIFSFDTERNRFEKLDVTLPQRLTALSCVAAEDQNIYCFGGVRFSYDRKNINSDTVIAFNPKRERVEVLDVPMVEPMAGHSCVYVEDENTAYCLGGTVESGSSVISYALD